MCFEKIRKNISIQSLCFEISKKSEKILISNPCVQYPNPCVQKKKNICSQYLSKSDPCVYEEKSELPSNDPCANHSTRLKKEGKKKQKLKEKIEESKEE